MKPIGRLLCTAQVLSCAISANACEARSATEPPLPPGTRVGWYVAPTGAAGNSGATGSPWDLTTALSGGNGKVRAGDTIWLRRGTYRGQFSSGLSGTAANPIVVRAYPGERATIDGGTGGTGRIETLTVSGQYVIYWGLEIMQSSTGRLGEAGTGTPLRPTGVYVQSAAHDVKLINVIVHDAGHGIYTENTAHNIEIYGWIIYNGGVENAKTGGRSDGHGIYIKNDGIGWKIARDNVIFDQFGFGIHGYAEAGQALKNIVLDGNVLFNNGTPSDYDNPNMQLGGTVVADNDTVTNNRLYFSPGKGYWNARIGYGATANGAALFANNYVVGGSQTLDLGYWSNLTVQANTIVGSNMLLAQHDPQTPSTQHWSGNTHYRDPSASAWQFNGNKTFSAWQSATGAADVASATLPAAAQVFVRPNLYEPGRATIVVYNWAGQASVAVPVTGVLSSGDQYQVRNVQDIFAAPVASGTYGGGGTISIPMGGVNPPQPIGGSFQPLSKTGPVFDVFVLTRS